MRKRKKLTKSAKIVLIVTAFLLVIDTALGIVFATVSSDAAKGLLNRKMIEIAQTAAKLVNADDIKTLTIADKENETEKYTKNLSILAAFKTTSSESGADLAYIYCLVKNDEGKIVFSLDPSDDPGGFLTEEPIHTAAMDRAFNGKTAIDDKAYVDRWGKLYSAYAPIISTTNEVVGIIGVDTWAKWYDEQAVRNGVTIAIISVVTIAAGVLIAMLITFSNRKRIDEIGAEVRSLNSDVSLLINEIRKPEELETVANEESSGDDIVDLKKHINTAQKEIRRYIVYSQQRAYSDSLTKIKNRLAYFEKVKSINESISNSKAISFAVLVYDVNELKDINDTYGHEFGDIALITSANIIKQVHGEDNVYRIGGDEFVVIVENATKKELEEKEQLFNQGIESYNSGENELPVDLGLSCGTAFFDKKIHEEFLDVFRTADKNMYKEKELAHKAKKK